MRVLALDPGYDRLGVAVVEREGDRDTLVYSGCLSSKRTDSFPLRIHSLGTQLEALLKEYKPALIALETLFFNKNQKTGLGVAEVRGMVLYLAGIYGCAVKEFSPQEVKIAVTGYGKSDKQAVIMMVKRLVAHAPAKALDDEYDAIAVAITALSSYRGALPENLVAEM